MIRRRRFTHYSVHTQSNQGHAVLLYLSLPNNISIHSVLPSLPPLSPSPSFLDLLLRILTQDVLIRSLRRKRAFRYIHSAHRLSVRCSIMMEHTDPIVLKKSIIGPNTARTDTIAIATQGPC